MRALGPGKLHEDFSYRSFREEKVDRETNFCAGLVPIRDDPPLSYGERNFFMQFPWGFRSP